MGRILGVDEAKDIINMLRRYAFLMLLLLFAVVMPADSQTLRKFSVASFEQDQFDTAAKGAYKKMDANGSLYAIIKVTSNNPDDNLSEYHFNFSNVRHEEVGKDGELWVYVARNAKRVTITRKGFATIKGYDLETTIQPGVVYKMQLSVTATPVYTQMVQFNVKPANTKAVITIKSIKKDAQKDFFGTIDTTGSVAKSLPLGTYTYEIVAENYHPSEGQITLNDKAKTHVEEVVLRPNFSEITLQVDADADIYVNSEKKGRRVWKGILKSGNYQVECRQQYHRNSTQMITVVENNNLAVDLVAPTPITGTLSVTSQPLGASIRIDGKDYGVTPKNITDIIIGRHTVELSKPHFKNEWNTVEVEENHTATIDVKMSNITKMTIKSTPTDATLYINGKEMGQTPYTGDLASGEYDIRISKVKYHDFKKHVTLDSSKPTVSYSLKRRYEQTNSGYIQGEFQFGSLMGYGAAVGAYLSDFNIEGSFLMGIQKSEDIYFAYNGNDLPALKYKPMVFAGKIGYRVLPYITPQLGVEYVHLKSEGDVELNTHVLAATIGVRLSYTIFDRIGLFAVPQYSYALQKPGVYQKLQNISTKIKGWGTGFNGRVGVCVYL